MNTLTWVRTDSVPPALNGAPTVPSLLSTLAVLVVFAGGAWWAWRAGARPLALGLGSLAVLPAITLYRQLTWPMLLAAAGLLGAVVWHRWARTSATVTRWGARARRKSGVASSLDIARKGSGRAMRAKAATVRPSLAELGRVRRRRVPVAETAVLLCRVGAQQVWSSIETVVLVFGGPRVGKSAWMAGRIIDAPGAALVTSTRTDLYQLTGQLRQAKGPVFVFNAAGLGGIASTMTFDPLTGCTDPVAATERATDMVAATVAQGGGGDRAFWESQARRVLAALLHAAALGELSMRQVQDWVSRPDSARDQLTSLLRRSPEPGFVEEIGQFLATNDRTRTSITSTIMPALGWLTSPHAARATTGGHPLDVAELLRSKGTVYLLGAEETHTASLVCALTGYVAREARRLAALEPSGRLDPPLGLFLDEAALVSPVPLDRWSADMGGRGVCIVAAFQSRSQLIDRYGQARAATIINNAGTKVIFGGTGDRDDLTYWSTLAGERDEPITTTDLHGRVASRTVRKVPVLAPAQLAQLPPHKVVVFAPGMPPVIGRAERAWRRPDVRAVQHPTSVRVRARALTARVLAAVAGSLTGVLRGIARGCRTAVAAVIAWAVAEWAHLRRMVAGVRSWIGARRRPVDSDVSTPGTADGTGPAAAEPAASAPDTAGGQATPFPATPWPADIDGDRAALPAGDWPSDNGHDNQGRWN